MHDSHKIWQTHWPSPREIVSRIQHLFISLRMAAKVSCFVFLVGLSLVVADELIVKTIKEPKNCPRRAKRGDQLQVHYVGRLTDENGKIFDESRPRGQTFNFQLGAGQVSRAELAENVFIFMLTNFGFISGDPRVRTGCSWYVQGRDQSLCCSSPFGIWRAWS